MFDIGATAAVRGILGVDSSLASHVTFLARTRGGIAMAKGKQGWWYMSSQDRDRFERFASDPAVLDEAKERLYRACSANKTRSTKSRVATPKKAPVVKVAPPARPRAVYLVMGNSPKTSSDAARSVGLMVALRPTLIDGTWKDIADAANAAKIYTVRGKPWTPQNLFNHKKEIQAAFEQCWKTWGAGNKPRIRVRQPKAFKRAA